MTAKTISNLAPGSLPIRLGLIARVRQSLFPAGKIVLAQAPLRSLPAPQSPQSISFNASIAEFLLVVRLKARSQRKVQAAQMLERASHIVLVTCNDWFLSEDGNEPARRKPL